MNRVMITSDNNMIVFIMLYCSIVTSS